MANLPELPNTIKRKLELQWLALVEAKQTPEPDTEEDAWLGEGPHCRYDPFGTDFLVALGQAQFKILCEEYRKLWLSSGATHEVFVGWLGILARQVVAKVDGTLPPNKILRKKFYSREVKTALEGLVKKETKWAIAKEISKLSSGSQEQVTLPVDRSQLRTRQPGAAAIPDAQIDASTQPTAPPVTETGQDANGPEFISEASRSAKVAPKVKHAGGKRGPKPMDERIPILVAGIVDRIAPDGNWRAKLDELKAALYHGVCGASDPETCCDWGHEKIKLPRGWEKKKASWLRPPDDSLFIKSIEERLNRVGRNFKSETPG